MSVGVSEEPSARGELTTSVQPAEPPQRPWRRSVVAGTMVWLASHALMILATFVYKMPRIADGQQPYGEVGPRVRDLLMQWKWWDSYQYMIIAEQGYGNPPQTTAFYPLYPLVSRAVHVVVPGDAFYSAMLVSTVSALVVLVLLHRLVTHELGEELASRTIFYLMAYPFAFFLNIGYNESLFLALAVGALYCMRRGHWWVAGLLGAFSSATRSAGVLLAPVLLYEYLRQRGFRIRAVRFDVASVLLVPLGIGAFALYCWHKFDNPLAFSDAQNAWGRKLTMPWTTFWNAAHTLNDGPALQPLNLYNFIDVTFTFAALVVLVLAAVGPWRLRLDQSYLLLYGGLIMLMVLLFPVVPPVSMASFPRYLVEIVPVFIVLAKMGQSRTFERFYLMPAIGMQAIWMVMFLNRLWAG